MADRESRAKDRLLAFQKWQGCGNDFVLVDCIKNDFSEGTDWAKISPRLCDRHYGVGGDGVILVLPSSAADFRMRIFNADGSEAEMCGNGIRCFARYLFDFGHTDKREFTVETDAGILTPEILFREGKVTGVKVDMGEAVLEGDMVPVLGYGKKRVVDEPIEALGETFRMTCVSMGNPHAVIFVDDAKKFDVARFGPVIERHEKFPKKTNVEFVEAVGKDHLIMRVWERGAAVTLACGTGSCASLVAGVLNGKTGKKARVDLDGGTLFVEWADNNHIYMTGPAEKIFSGEADIVA